MDTRTITVKRRHNGQWRLSRPEHDDVSGLSRPCRIRWELDPDTANEWEFDRIPLRWKNAASGAGFDPPVRESDSVTTVVNSNDNGKRHHYSLHFVNRRTKTPEAKDPSLQNYPRPNSMRERIDREVPVILGAVVLGGLLALLLGRRNWHRHETDEIEYGDS